MNENALRIFRMMLGTSPIELYVPESAALRDGVTVTVPAHYRERTDAELDALVSYALRADAACRRESARYAAAHPVPRPQPTGVPGQGRPVEISTLDRALNRLFGVR